MYAAFFWSPGGGAGEVRGLRVTHPSPIHPIKGQKLGVPPWVGEALEYNSSSQVQKSGSLWTLGLSNGPGTQ